MKSTAELKKKSAEQTDATLNNDERSEEKVEKYAANEEDANKHTEHLK